MPFANAGILIASASGSEVAFTNGEQPGVRLVKAAAAHSPEPARTSPTVTAKAARRKGAKATEKK